MDELDEAVGRFPRFWKKTKIESAAEIEKVRGLGLPGSLHLKSRTKQR